MPRSPQLDALSDVITRVLHEHRNELALGINDKFYREMVLSSPDLPPETGFCAAAADALYHLGGGKAAGLKRMRARIDAQEIHWWVVDAEGNIYDPTAGQFVDDADTLFYLYVTGRGGAPSSAPKRGRAEQAPLKLAQRIMDLVNLGA
jgi:hypothetical protein